VEVAFLLHHNPINFKEYKNVTIQPTQNQLIDIDFDITDKCD